MRDLGNALLLLLVLFGFASAQETRKIHSTLKEIQAKEDHLDLELIQEWSGENEQDKNKILSEPRGLAVNRSGHIYILDANRIRVFDESGKYIKTIGGVGEGPGDLLDPALLVIDKQDNIVLFDGGKQRVQILSSDGKYLGGFPLGENRPGPIAITRENEILMSNRTLTKEAAALWIYYDYQGKTVRQNGQRYSGSSELVNDKLYEVSFALDEKDNLYAAYVYKPHIQVYSLTGELIRESTYEVPFEIPEIRSFTRPEGIFIEAEIICRGIDVDTKGRVYLLTLTRPRKSEERKIGYVISAISRDGRISKSEKMKFNIDTRETDLNQILVFDQSGKIIASKKLTTYANNIKIYADKLFLIDSYVNMKIYEYRFAFEGPD